MVQLISAKQAKIYAELREIGASVRSAGYFATHRVTRSGKIKPRKRR